METDVEPGGEPGVERTTEGDKKGMISKDEMQRYIKYIFAEHEQPTEFILIAWYDQFSKIDKKLFTKATRLLKTKKTYGAPKIQDMWGCLTELRLEALPRSLAITPGEAFIGKDSLIKRDALEYAHYQAPPARLVADVKFQQIRYKQAFEDRYQRVKDECIRLVTVGTLTPPQAVIQVLEQKGLISIPDSAYEHAGLPVPEAKQVGWTEEVIKMVAEKRCQRVKGR